MIKMKVNNDKASKCDNCERPWNKTKEMYDTMILNNRNTLCKECLDVMFYKLLTASCMYNARLKSQEDFDRKYRSEKYHAKKKF